MVTPGDTNSTLKEVGGGGRGGGEGEGEGEGEEQSNSIF